MSDNSSKMVIVRIEPAGIELRVRSDETLMAAARAQGYYWPNQCNMECRCATCFILVEKGAENLSAMSRGERATLLEQRGRSALDQPVRLACQTLALGNATIRKRGVRPI